MAEGEEPDASVANVYYYANVLWQDPPRSLVLQQAKNIAAVKATR